MRSEVGVLWPFSQGSLQSYPFWGAKAPKETGNKKNQTKATIERKVTQRTILPYPSIQGMCPNSLCFRQSPRVWLFFLAGAYPASKLTQPWSCNQASLPSREALLPGHPCTRSPSFNSPSTPDICCRCIRAGSSGSQGLLNLVIVSVGLHAPSSDFFQS